jgi:N-acetylglucosaminyldiphosphoundecaprenol N-acetyl-beta-D-mannosaminyltransferase
MASSILSVTIRERVTGSEVFYGLHQRMNTADRMSVFFLGATEETLALIRTRMEKGYPSIRVAGTYSPPFKPTYSPEELDEIINAINSGKGTELIVERFHTFSLFHFRNT